MLSRMLVSRSGTTHVGVQLQKRNDLCEQQGLGMRRLFGHIMRHMSLILGNDGTTPAPWT